MSDRELSPRRIRQWARLSAINLAIVALLGVALRYKAAFSLPGLDYKYLLNAHSHFAFSGWVTTALFTALLYILQASGGRPAISYRFQFWLNQVASFGMLLSFTFRGYDTVSIIFSALSVLFSYWFAFCFWRDSGQASWAAPVKRCVRLALLFLVLSSAGPFLLAYCMSLAVGNMAFYYNAIYLYLHFQYNGWFTFGVLGLLLWSAPTLAGGRVVTLMGVACVPAYCLSLLWTGPPVWVYAAGGFAGALQVVALGFLFRELLRNRADWGVIAAPVTRRLWALAVLAFGIKIGLQALSVIPGLGNLAFSHRPVVIAYLHLVVLGFVTFLLLGFFYRQRLVRPRKSGLAVFAGGVIVNELLLLVQSCLLLGGIFWPQAGYYLLGAAMALLTGAILIAAG